MKKGEERVKEEAVDDGERTKERLLESERGQKTRRKINDRRRCGKMGDD